MTVQTGVCRLDPPHADPTDACLDCLINVERDLIRAEKVPGETLAVIRAAVETMATARIISQWDYISRKAVLALIDAEAERK